MRCPYCGYMESEVVETRISEEKENIRRRRECAKCKKRFTTYERIENVTLMIKKKDGRREQFDREKLRLGIIKASDKTTVSLLHINAIVEHVEMELRSGDKLEIESRKIGQMVAARLKRIDKVAYIRFASVFKRFVDAEDFQEEIQRLRS